MIEINLGRACASQGRQPGHQSNMSETASINNHTPPPDIRYLGNVWDNAAMQNFFSAFNTERTARNLPIEG